MPSWKKVITSGSDAILKSITATAGFTGSFTGSLEGIATTASHYTETDPVFTAKSGSFATTGSNTFTNSQTIDGNIFLSGSARLVYNNNPSSSLLFGQFDGGTIHGPYYQQFGNAYANISQRGGAEVIYDIRNNADANFHVASFNGSTWIQKFLVNDDGVQITGSLNVSNGITGSLQGIAATASYVDSANVYGPNGSNSVNYASIANTAYNADNATTADRLNSPVTQNLELRGHLTTRVDFSNYATMANTQFAYYGDVIAGTVVTPITQGIITFLNASGEWAAASTNNNSATKLLGVYAYDDSGTAIMLLDGTITIPLTLLTANIGEVVPGQPVYLGDNGSYVTNVDFITRSYKRLVGYILTTDEVNNFVLKFRPSNDWTQE